MNPEVRMGTDMRTPAGDESCDLLAADYQTCADIEGTLAAGEDFSAVIVLYTFQAVRGVAYALQWPADWEVYEFESCSDLLVGGEVGENPMEVYQVWTDPVASRGGTSGIPLGVLRGTATSAGCVEIVAITSGDVPVVEAPFARSVEALAAGTGDIEVVDAFFQLDYVVEAFSGCAGTPSPGDPCAFDSVLIADLWAENRVGPSPLEVTFHDASRGSPTGWFWDFGDGASSTLQHPAHVYDTCGVYTVSLEVTNASATDDTMAADFAWAQTAVVPDFAADPRSGCRPLEVHFTDLTAGHPTSWLWQFGDGATSTEANPVHVYADSGFIQVTLTVADECSTLVLNRPGYITVSGPPQANFTASPETGCGDTEVHFLDRSGGHPLTWSWDFGDGATSTERSPYHTYTEPGSYSVSLTVTNGCSTSTFVRPDPIVISAGAHPDFAADPVEGCIPLSVQFTDLTPEEVLTWQWDFGDGGTSGEQNPLHVYPGAGLYTVTLRVTNPCGTFTATRDSLVRVGGDPADFSADATAGCAPFDVHFTDHSDPFATAWSWDFGDGGTSTERNPVHTYTAAGIYDVSLEVAAPCGTTSITREGFIRADSLTVASFTASDSSRCAPFSVHFTDLSVPVPRSWAWSFGDGGTSTQQNPTHVYTTVGSFTVSLQVEGDCGVAAVVRDSLIHTDRDTCVEFSADQVNGCTPLTVQFTDLTGPLPGAWFWEFGDGQTSTERNPVHVYTPIRRYDVSLTVTYPTGMFTLDKDDYITVRFCRSITVATIDFAGSSPARGEVDLVFALPDGEHAVRIAVYDARGRVVKELLAGVRGSGAYRLEWNGQDGTGRDVPAGVYFVRLETPDETATKKVILYR